jgi:hypothetical protein
LSEKAAHIPKGEHTLFDLLNKENALAGAAN